MPTEPYLLGSHSGCCGIWVSGPADVAPPEWQWGYNRMTTVKGLFTAGDGVGASGHKFSSGSHAEGRIAGKNMVKFCLDHPDYKPVFKADIKAITEEIYRPVRNYIEHKERRRPRTSIRSTSRRACSRCVCKRSWTNMSLASPPTTRPTAKC